MRAEIVHLRTREGLSYTEIAARLGTTRCVVAGHIYRARRGAGTKRPPAVLPPPRVYVPRNLATDPATRSVVDLMNESPLSDTAIATRAGVGVSTIRHWRSGRAAGHWQYLEWVREAISGPGTVRLPLAPNYRGVLRCKEGTWELLPRTCGAGL